MLSWRGVREYLKRAYPAEIRKTPGVVNSGSFIIREHHMEHLRPVYQKSDIGIRGSSERYVPNILIIEETGMDADNDAA